MALSFQQARNGTKPAATPMTTAPELVTNPQAGVITTKPGDRPGTEAQDAGCAANEILGHVPR